MGQGLQGGRYGASGRSVIDRRRLTDSQMGQSGCTVTIHGKVVVKSNAPSREPLYMMEHPDVFVPVLSAQHYHNGQCEYVMPRLFSVGLSPKREAIPMLLEGLQLLEHRLWSKSLEGPINCQWPDALRERMSDYLRPRLAARLVDAVDKKTRDVHLIHGDPTIANLYIDNSGLPKWGDPLLRIFIPGDRHVDVGKAFQSLWAYEEVLHGKREFSFDAPNAQMLADTLGVSYDLAYAWSLIHLARLIPYVDGRISDAVFKVIEKC